MSLQFPTQAEKCLREFRDSNKTVSIVTIAKRMGAVKTFNHPVTTYTFDDDTSLTVSGRGVGHKIECHLP